MRVFMPGHAARVLLPPAPSGDPESLIPPGLAPRRPSGRVRRVEERGHRLGEVARTTDISGEVKRRFRPGLKAGVSTPRF
jgi:hypothetical protein